jgi:hypothetical protein
LHHGEERVVVFLDLRPLVPLAGVLDGKRMEPEFLRHLIELRWRRIKQGDPDEAVRAADILADVFDRNVAELAAVLISDAVDEHRGAPERGSR